MASKVMPRLGQIKCQLTMTNQQFIIFVKYLARFCFSRVAIKDKQKGCVLNNISK